MNMLMAYLVFLLSLFFIRMIASYDSRYRKGKYLRVKNRVLNRILLSSTSIYAKTKRRKSDRSKMAIRGVVFYAAAALVVLINVVFLIVPDIPIEPWCIDTSRFIVYADTLNDKISAISILLLFLSIMGYTGFAFAYSERKSDPKWAKILIWVMAILMILVSVSSSIYLLIELFKSFNDVFSSGPC